MTDTLLFLLLSFFSNTPGNIDCRNLKEGIFKLESVDGGLHTIVRTKNKQTENVAITGEVSEYDIKWTSDCSYMLYNRKIIKGVDDMSSDFDIDTLYNEIVDINGDKHKVVSSIKQSDMKVETILTKIDTALLYRNLSDLEKFKDYNGTTWGGTLIGNDFSVAYRQNINDKTNYLLAFEEVLLLNHRSKYRLLDHLNFKMQTNQNLATSNCRFNDKYDKEIVAIYSSKNENKEAVIIKAWRFNRHTLKIEEIEKGNVKYKAADKDLFLWDK
jgi:hypothetical protein